MFIRKKTGKPKEQVQRSLAEINRENSRDLIVRLEMAKKEASGMGNEGLRGVFVNVITAFGKQISEAPVITQYDTAEMDQNIQRMIESLGVALKKGDLDTAKRGVNLIHDALQTCRCPLRPSEAEKQQEVLKERVTRLGQMKSILIVSDKVFVNYCNNRDSEKKYTELKGRYEKKFGEIEDTISRHPRQYEALQNYVPGDKMSEDVRELYENMQELDRIKQQVDVLKSQMNTFRSAYDSQKAELEGMENMLSVQNGRLSSEERDSIQQAMEEFQKGFAEQQLEVTKLDEMMSEHHNAIMNMMESMETGRSVVRASQAFEEMRREHEWLAREEAEDELDAQKTFSPENDSDLSSDSDLLYN